MVDLIEPAAGIPTPAFDPDSLAASADAIRATIPADRPDLAAKAELAIKTAYLRSGISEPQASTAQEVAQAQHEAAFSITPNANLTEMLDNHRAALEAANGPNRLREMAGRLREEMGHANYDAMVAQARHAVDGEMPAAVLADRLLLRNAAGWGKYNLAREATKPRNVKLKGE